MYPSTIMVHVCMCAYYRCMYIFRILQRVNFREKYVIEFQAYKHFSALVSRFFLYFLRCFFFFLFFSLYFFCSLLVFFLAFAFFHYSIFFFLLFNTAFFSRLSEFYDSLENLDDNFSSSMYARFFTLFVNFASSYIFTLFLLVLPAITFLPTFWQFL
jgi:hypothetical protein